MQLIRQFIPAGYKLLAMASGDLNRDPYPDKLLILRSTQADTTIAGDETPRPLLLLVGAAGGQYHFAVRNDSMVLCSGCGGMMGDPYQGVTIKRGFFSLEYYGGSGWRWSRITTFKYNPTDHHWYLHRDGGESFHASEPEKVETQIQTVRDFGRIRLEEYSSHKQLAQ